MSDVLFYHNYVISGDIIAIVICIAIFMLSISSYMIRQKNLRLFLCATAIVLISSICSIVYHNLTSAITYKRIPWIYLTRFIIYGGLIWVYIMICVYIRRLIPMKPREVPIFRLAIFVPGIFFTAWELAGPIMKLGFYIDNDLLIHQNYYNDIFRIAYAYYSLCICVILLTYHNKMVRRILKCIWWTYGVTMLLMAYQQRLLDTTYTCIAFAFPIITAFFLFHYNSYNVDTGTLDSNAFDSYIEDMHGRDITLVFLSVYKGEREVLNHWLRTLFQSDQKETPSSFCFRLDDSRVAIGYQKDKHSAEHINSMIQDFTEYYNGRTDEYHIIIVESDDQLLRGESYLALCRYLELKMTANQTIRCTAEDITSFTEAQTILKELKDISLKKNLNDPRVIVYCQPIMNTGTHTFTTSEALMRLDLPELGLLTPDRFIPLAEQFGLIHDLSRIILNKTCVALRKLLDQGYDIDHISVNFSIRELSIDTFCQEIESIIKTNHVPFQKIAIELTESKNERDFVNASQVMSHLQELGINFLLDDFGTGYSNFERIMCLPINIIKFDRSLTLLTEKDNESKYMVGSFSNIFNHAGYKVLFEGVENEAHEHNSTDMGAKYLQGYRYSKPIPISELSEFLNK